MQYRIFNFMWERSNYYWRHLYSFIIIITIFVCCVIESIFIFCVLIVLDEQRLLGIRIKFQESSLFCPSFLYIFYWLIGLCVCVVIIIHRKKPKSISVRGTSVQIPRLFVYIITVWLCMKIFCGLNIIIFCSCFIYINHCLDFSSNIFSKQWIILFWIKKMWLKASSTHYALSTHYISALILVCMIWVCRLC